MSEEITPIERLMSLYQTGWADRPGIGAFAMGFIARMSPGLSVGELYKDQLLFVRAYLKVQELFGFDSGPLIGHACFGAAEFGGELSYPSPTSRGQSPGVKKHPVTTPEQVDALEVPDPKEAGEIPMQMEATKYVLDNYPEGYKNPSPVGGTPFTAAGNVMGVERMLVWMAKQPDLVHTVLKKVTEFYVELVKYYIDEVGPLLFFDGGPTDSNDLISPKQFEEFSLPYFMEFRKKTVKLGAQFLCHPCGNQTKNAHMWAQPPGTFAVNFDFRTPLEQCVETFKSTSMVVGNIEPAKFLTMDYDGIYNKTMEYLHIAATQCPHGYMVGPGCELPVDTPAVNLYAMIRATKDYAQSKEWQEHRPA